MSDRTCRYPVGDPQDANFHFCGNAPKGRAPYCEPHCRKVYEPKRAKVDDGRRHNGRPRQSQGLIEAW